MSDTIQSLTITQASGKVTTLTPATTRQYYRIKQDDELDDYERPSDGKLRGKPAVFRLEEHHYTALTEGFQFMWYRLNNPAGFT